MPVVHNISRNGVNWTFPYRDGISFHARKCVENFLPTSARTRIQALIFSLSYPLYAYFHCAYAIVVGRLAWRAFFRINAIKFRIKKCTRREGDEASEIGSRGQSNKKYNRSIVIEDHEANGDYHSYYHLHLLVVYNS